MSIAIIRPVYLPQLPVFSILVVCCIGLNRSQEVNFPLISCSEPPATFADTFNEKAKHKGRRTNQLSQ